MAFMDVVRGLTKGLALASGNEPAAQEIDQQEERQRQKQAENQKFIMAPLVQAQTALTHRLMLYANAADPTKPQEGHEQEYDTVRQQLYDVSRQIHGVLSKPPKNEKKRAAWDAQTNSQAQAAMQSGTPSMLSPDEHRQAARIKAGIDPKAVQGKENLKLYKLKNGTFAWIDASKPELIPEGAQAVGAGTQGVKGVKGTLVRSKQSPTGFAQTWVDPFNPSKIVGWQPVTPSRFYQGTQTERTSVDPFGVKTSTSSTTRPITQGEIDLSGVPQTGEMEPGANDGSKPATKPVAAPTKVEPFKSTGPKAQALRGTSQKLRNLPPLDENGHIPPSAGNPLLVEAANNLMDGMDVTKLPVPQKDRAAVEQLAKQFRWKGQGLFAPGDLMRVRNSLGIINEFEKGDVLSVLDSGFSRQKISQAISDIEKRGPTGQALQTFISGHLSPLEQQYVNIYLQAVGRISGLSQLVRSGRPTEATINRLKSELPHPGYTGSKAAALDKLRLLHQEIDIALDKGQFLDAAPSEKEKKVLKFNIKTGRLE